jgi:hypothetical protein
MLQPPHFNVAARDLAHERTCETAANRLRMLRLPGAAGNHATELQQCGLAMRLNDCALLRDVGSGSLP